MAVALKLKRIKGRPGKWALYQGKQYLPQAAWPAGFKSEWSYEEAHAYKTTLNARSTLLAREEKKARTLQRIQSDEEKRCAWLPLNVVVPFEATYIPPTSSPKTKSQWQLVKRLIIGVNQDPATWALNPKPIWSWFCQNPRSLDYVQRCIRMLNWYGHMYSLTYSRPFSPAPTPKGAWRIQIDEGFENRKKSDILTEPQLRLLKPKLSEEEWNWVAVCWAFGLRPQECDQFLNRKEKTWEIESGPVLHIYQPKLKWIKKERRWKRVDLYTDFQKTAVKLVRAQNLARPSVKKARRTFPPGVTLYGCRHGFAAFHDEAGQSIETISSWLGHQSLATTQKFYQDHGILKKAHKAPSKN